MGTTRIALWNTCDPSTTNILSDINVGSNIRLMFFRDISHTIELSDLRNGCFQRFIHDTWLLASYYRMIMLSLKINLLERFKCSITRVISLPYLRWVDQVTSKEYLKDNWRPKRYCENYNLKMIIWKCDWRVIFHTNSYYKVYIHYNVWRASFPKHFKARKKTHSFLHPGYLDN